MNSKATEIVREITDLIDTQMGVTARVPLHELDSSQWREYHIRERQINALLHQLELPCASPPAAITCSKLP